MHTLTFLKEHSLSDLVATYDLHLRQYDNLSVLNYHTSTKPKDDPIVIECRSLVLDNQFNVVSRTFDRIFNLGECPATQTHLDWGVAHCYEKIDGVMLNIAYYENSWQVRTRRTAYAESTINDNNNISYADLALAALGCVDKTGLNELMERASAERDVTYICELTSPLNRIVKQYDHTQLWLLAARRVNGEYLVPTILNQIAQSLAINRPQIFRFGTASECKAVVENLQNLDEGYVVYQNNIPVCKIKSPSYVATHYQRFHLATKNMALLVLDGEHTEFLTYFPQKTDIIMSYVNTLTEMLDDAQHFYEGIKQITNQKEFVSICETHRLNAAIFKARRCNQSVAQAFYSLQEAYRLKQLIAAYQQKYPNSTKDNVTSISN